MRPPRRDAAAFSTWPSKRRPPSKGQRLCRSSSGDCEGRGRTEPASDRDIGANPDRETVVTADGKCHTRSEVVLIAGKVRPSPSVHKENRRAGTTRLPGRGPRRGLGHRNWSEIGRGCRNSGAHVDRSAAAGEASVGLAAGGVQPRARTSGNGSASRESPTAHLRSRHLHVGHRRTGPPAWPDTRLGVDRRHDRGVDNQTVPADDGDGNCDNGGRPLAAPGRDDSRDGW